MPAAAEMVGDFVFQDGHHPCFQARFSAELPLIVPCGGKRVLHDVFGQRFVAQLDGGETQDGGSQGQIRTVVLALKMAEVLLSEEILGEKPLLLLDDVMSELDEDRRKAIMEFAFHDIQTVITTTNLGYFSEEILEKAQIVRFSDE